MGQVRLGVGAIFLQILLGLSMPVVYGCGSHEGSPDDGVAGSRAQGFDLNDVSVLYPLPEWAARDTLLAPNETGAQGALIPRASYDAAAPDLALGFPFTPTDTYASLRVVGVRVDPCFPADASEAPACLRQIRLVLQPVIQDEAGALTTIDAAVHALYVLDDALWEDLLLDLGALRELTGGGTQGQPLQVHPVLSAEGLTGPYASALRTLILKAAGEATLSELAFMVLTKVDTTWGFSKLKRLGTTFEPVVVPLLDVQEQTTSMNLLDPAAVPPPRSFIISPAPTGSLIHLLADTSTDQSLVESAVREALLIDNPTSPKNPQTMDCVSCHLATRNRSYIEQVRQIDTSTWQERFTADDYDLRRTDEVGDDPRSLRSFGYFQRRSSIGERVIHESALVARALSR